MSWMLLPPKYGGISMTFTATFCMETIFEMASRLAAILLSDGIVINHYQLGSEFYSAAEN
jgi:hypothetical protein